MSPRITAELAEELRAHHVAFLKERLVSPAAEQEWAREAPRVFEAFLDAQVGDVIDPGALSNALSRVLTRESVRRVVAPVARKALKLALDELGDLEGVKLARFLPLGGVDKLQRLLERPDLVPERAVREIVEHPAMEEVMRDVLEAALVEFGAKVNPLQIAKKLIPFGALAAGLEAVRGEFEKRIEPERKKFLQAFSRRALQTTADAVLARRDAPQFVELRKHLAAAVLDQEIAVLAREADREALRLSNELAIEVTGAIVEDAEVRVRRAIVEPVRGATVREALASLGVDPRVDVEVLARATWPLVRTMLVSPPVLAWLDAIAHEMYASIIDHGVAAGP